jgi:hypothetical protein
LKLFLGNVQLYSRTHVGKSANDSDFEYVYDLMLEHATDIDQTKLENRGNNRGGQCEVSVFFQEENEQTNW